MEPLELEGMYISDNAAGYLLWWLDFQRDILLAAYFFSEITLGGCLDSELL